MQLGQIAGAVGRGLAAGLAGTAAMTVSSTLEAKLRDRGSSTTPAQALEKVTGVEPVDGQASAPNRKYGHAPRVRLRSPRLCATSARSRRLRVRGATLRGEMQARPKRCVIPGGCTKQTLNNAAHWGYGTAWGGVRGLLGAAGLHGPAAAAAHLAAVWAAEQAMLPALALAPPATQWGHTEVRVDLFHHTVYALATTLAYEWLERR